MNKVIVAIGGGENGRLLGDGTTAPYETEKIDLEIIKLTGKEHPNFLFLGHSQTNPNIEKSYFETMKKIYGERLGCSCDTITRRDLENNDFIEEKISWADIIYEGGGDTLKMMDLWKKTSFDKVLEKAWNNGKVMCGVSAGANCWFRRCSSDSLQIERNDKNAPMINVNCLGFVNAFFTPHCNEMCGNISRLAHMKSSLENSDLVGIAMSNCSALVIVNDKYKVITTDASNYNISAYGLKAYYKNGKYINEKLEVDKYKDLDKLLNVR